MKKIFLSLAVSLICTSSFAQIQNNEHDFGKNYTKSNLKEKQKLLKHCWKSLSDKEQKNYIDQVVEIRNLRKGKTFEDKLSFNKESASLLKDIDKKCNLQSNNDKTFNVINFLNHHLDMDKYIVAFPYGDEEDDEDDENNYVEKKKEIKNKKEEQLNVVKNDNRIKQNSNLIRTINADNSEPFVRMRK